MINFLKKNWVYYVINVFLAIGIYYGSNLYNLTNHAHTRMFCLQTPLDRAIPFIPQFIVIYNSIRPVIYITLVFFFIFHPKIFTAMASAFISLFLISNGVYLVFQTYVPRPSLSPHTNWYVDQVIKLYKSDNPYNCFPSLHCGTSALAASFWFVKKRYRVVACIMTVWAILIVLSTQFLKQHVLADIVGSFLAIGLYFLFYKMFHLETER